jgi:hypothetical protein
MPFQSVWAWTVSVSANAKMSGLVSGSMDVHIPTQSFAYVSTALQRLRLFEQPSPDFFQSILVNAHPVIAAVNGANQPAGSTVAFGSNVESVNFSWTVDPGSVEIGEAPYEVNAQFLFQILGSG